MKHEHITPRDERWDKRKYICICGFVTGDRLKFDQHLREKSNQAVEPTVNAVPKCNNCNDVCDWPKHFASCPKY